MKPKEIVLASSLFLLSLAALPGCASGGVPPLLTASTNAVPTVVQTNAPVIQVVTVTNTVGQVAQTFQTNFIPVTVTNWTTNVVYQPSGTAQTVISTAQGINTVTGPFNPFSGAIAAGLALLSGGLTWYARQKTAQVNQHLSTIQTLTTAAASLEPAALAAYHAAVANTGSTTTKAQMLTNAAQAAAQNLAS